MKQEIIKSALLLIAIIVCQSAIAKVYEVCELTEVSGRTIEKINSIIKVNGTLGKTGNIGYPVYVLADNCKSSCYILIYSKKKTLPGDKGDNVTLKLQLKEEVKFLGRRVLVFEELGLESTPDNYSKSKLIETLKL